MLDLGEPWEMGEVSSERPASPVPRRSMMEKKEKKMKKKTKKK